MNQNMNQNHGTTDDIASIPFLILIFAASLLLDTPVAVVDSTAMDVKPSELDAVVGNAVNVPAVEVTVVSKALVLTVRPLHATNELIG